MKNLEKDLQAVNKDLNALSKKVEKLIVAVGKAEEPRAAKAKPAKKAVLKKEKKMTAPDIVLGIINIYPIREIFIRLSRGADRFDDLLINKRMHGLVTSFLQ